MEEKKKNPVDTKLLKLSNELQNSLRDPETKDYVQDIIAALAFGNFPNLGQRLATLARDPRVREEAMNKVRNFTGDEGPRLHESEILKQNKQLIEEIRQMKESMGLPKDSSMGTEKQAISFDQQGKIEAQEPLRLLLGKLCHKRAKPCQQPPVWVGQHKPGAIPKVWLCLGSPVLPSPI